MVQYRRSRAPGGTYFFTIALNDRRSRLLVDHVGLLANAVRDVRHARPFALDAIVVLPDHLHAVLTLPCGDADYPGRWRAVKARFARELRRAGLPLRRNRSGEYDLWQRRFWEHRIRGERDFAVHVDYIHFNPVKHGHVTRVDDWPYSSFHRYVRLGILPADWAGGSVDRPDGGFGE
ncbi:MAG TPA: transposase [Gammaproteobacteria bacterium]|nr:transposase [Gammaproteobacteria bacterium]